MNPQHFLTAMAEADAEAGPRVEARQDVVHSTALQVRLPSVAPDLLAPGPADASRQRGRGRLRGPHSTRLLSPSTRARLTSLDDDDMESIAVGLLLAEEEAVEARIRNFAREQRDGLVAFREALRREVSLAQAWRQWLLDADDEEEEDLDDDRQEEEEDEDEKEDDEEEEGEGGEREEGPDGVKGSRRGEQEGEAGGDRGRDEDADEGDAEEGVGRQSSEERTVPSLPHPSPRSTARSGTVLSSLGEGDETDSRSRERARGPLDEEEEDEGQPGNGGGVHSPRSSSLSSGSSSSPSLPPSPSSRSSSSSSSSSSTSSSSSSSSSASVSSSESTSTSSAVSSLAARERDRRRRTQRPGPQTPQRIAESSGGARPTASEFNLGDSAGGPNHRGGSDAEEDEEEEEEEEDEGDDAAPLELQFFMDGDAPPRRSRRGMRPPRLRRRDVDSRVDADEGVGEAASDRGRDSDDDDDNDNDNDSDVGAGEAAGALVIGGRRQRLDDESGVARSAPRAEETRLGSTLAVSLPVDIPVQLRKRFG